MHSVQFPLRNASTLLERVNRVNQLTTKGLDLQHCQVLLLVIELLILLSREAADAAALVLLLIYVRLFHLLTLISTPLESKQALTGHTSFTTTARCNCDENNELIFTFSLVLTETQPPDLSKEARQWAAKFDRTLLRKLISNRRTRTRHDQLDNEHSTVTEDCRLCSRLNLHHTGWMVQQV